MPQSFLEKDIGGLYNPAFRFAFTNITDSDFTSYWDKIPIIVKAHETIEVSNVTPIPGAGHAMAVKMTGELVDLIIIGKAKMDELEKNQPYYRSPKGSDLGVPAARKVWEDQILRQLDSDEDSPAIQSMRKEILKDINNEINKEVPNVPMEMPRTVEEFAQIKKDGEVKAPKKAAKTKKLETA